MGFLEELVKESAERKRQEAKAKNVGTVAIYACCQAGDRQPVKAALNVCKQNGWEAIEYVDLHIPKDKDGKPSMYNHMVSDVSEGLIQVLVTPYASELSEFCANFGCKVVQAEG